MVAAGTAFDALAVSYDGLWSRTAIGSSQRQAVWRRVDPLFEPGDSILDLGCGTGEDALHFESRGVHVHGVDASAAMVQIAREREVNAHQLAAEEMGNLRGEFDGAISNFGVLNCVNDLRGVGLHLRRLVRRGGFAAVCVLSPLCLREIVHFLVRGKPRKAFRRFARGQVRTSLGVDVQYPSTTRLSRAFSDGFELVAWYGIGVCVPPSYVHGIGDETIARLARLDRGLAHLPAIRAIGDHRLLVFKRL